MIQRGTMSARCATALAMACFGLVGCGSSGLTTASLLSDGGTATAAQVRAKPEDPMARPLFVAATSAKAVKCGFYFDPQKLRASMLANEAKIAPPDQLQRAEKTYDNTYRLVSDRLRTAEEYCTEPATRAIKADLQRHLAGDFTPPVQKPKASDDGWFSSIPSNTVEPLDREKIFDPGPRARS